MRVARRLRRWRPHDEAPMDAIRRLPFTTKADLREQLGAHGLDAGQRKKKNNCDAGARLQTARYKRCIVHSVSMNMAVPPGGVRRLTLVCL